MGSVLHGNATTTPRIREEIQKSKESLAKLAKKYNLNEKTVQKWRHADGVVDKRSGPKQPKSALSTTEQQIVCEFRRLTRLSLDDIFVALRDQIPTLSRSNLHRCLQRNGLSVLPKEDGIPLKEKKKFKDYPIGFVHMDITEVRTEAGKCYIFVAIDRTSKYVYAEIHERMTAAIAKQFLHNTTNSFPFKINTILTDNGAQFTYELLAEHLRPKDKIHPFDEACKENGIEHRLTQFRHPWTNGQVEVTNRLIKKYTTKSYHYETMEELKVHLMTFLLYYNHERKLKALHYMSPFDKLIQEYGENPSLFLINPNQMILGLNT